MDWAKIKDSLVDKGIIALLAGALGVVFTNGQNGQIAETVAAIKTTVDEIKSERDKEKAYHACMVRTIDWLHAGGKGEKPCVLE